MKKLTRVFQLKAVETTESDVISIAISTETPYTRWYINGHEQAEEVLGHANGEIDFTYVADGAPFLFEHKTDNQIGVLENVVLGSDKVLRANVRFSNSEFAQSILDDIKNGIRKRISVGYEVLEYTDSGLTEDGRQIVRATKWMPLEASTVSIPADINAGVGRARDLNEIADQIIAILAEATEEEEAEEEEETVEEESKAEDDEIDATEDEDAKADDEIDATEDDEIADEETAAGTDDNITEDDEKKTAKSSKTKLCIDNSIKTPIGDAKMLTKEQIKELTQLATKYNMTEQLADWISEGRSVDSIKSQILDTRSNDTTIVNTPNIHTSKTRSYGDAVTSWLKGDNSEVAERGLDQARKSNTPVNRDALYLPTDEPMFKAAKMPFTRSSFGSNGSQATGKEYLTFEETLREGSLLTKVGGQVLVLNDVATVPYFSTPTTANMAAETGSVSTSTFEIGSYTWSPKRIAAAYSISNLLTRLNGTYDLESILYNDLLAEGIRKFDQQIWGGTGANNITGLAYNTSIDELGRSGSLAFVSGTQMITTVANNNANTDNAAFVMHNSVWGYAAGTPAFGAGSSATILDRLEAMHPVFKTGYLPTFVSSSHAAMFGDFSKVTAALFGPVVITRDDLTGAADGKTILRLELFCDCIARQPAALSKWTYITGV